MKLPLNTGISPRLGVRFGGPYKKDYSILGSILGSPYYGKLPYEKVVNLIFVVWVWEVIVSAGSKNRLPAGDKDLLLPRGQHKQVRQAFLHSSDFPLGLFLV